MSPTLLHTLWTYVNIVEDLCPQQLWTRDSSTVMCRLVHIECGEVTYPQQCGLMSTLSTTLCCNCATKSEDIWPQVCGPMSTDMCRYTSKSIASWKLLPARLSSIIHATSVDIWSTYLLNKLSLCYFQLVHEYMHRSCIVQVYRKLNTETTARTHKASYFKECLCPLVCQLYQTRNVSNRDLVVTTALYSSTGQ